MARLRVVFPRRRGRHALFALAVAAPPAAEETPRDPNDLPRMRAPGGQPQTDQNNWEPGAYTSNRSSRRRFALTVKPLFSAIRLPFVGRPNAPIYGGGAGIDADLQLHPVVWLRLGGSIAGHPVPNEFQTNQDDEIVQVAQRGSLTAAQAGLGVVFAFDFGRVLPMLDAGVGGMLLRPPAGDRDGQLGSECADGGVCDTGLVCASDNVCRQGLLFEVHAGFAVDVLIREHLTLGAGVRYFAIATDPGTFPIYTHVLGRLGVRF